MAVKAASAGTSLLGVEGNRGPVGVPYINFPNPNVPSYGHIGMMRAVNQNANNVYLFDITGGQAMPLLIRPLRDTSIAYVTLTNANASAGNVNLSLRNYATDAVVYSTGAIVKNSVFTNGPFSPGQYTLSAGQTYYWANVPTVSGAYTSWVVPQYHNPSASACATSTHPTFQLNPSFGGLLGLTPSTLSATPAYMGPPTFQNGTTFSFSIYSAGYVSNVQFVNGGNGTATFALQNTTSNTLAWQGPSLAAGATMATGNLPPSTIPLAAGTKYAWYVTGNGGGMAQNLTMQTCQ